jgi:CrcB protein
MSIPSFINIGLVGIAGALGALVRYLIGRFFAERVNSQFPLGTLIINISGAFLIGLLAGLVGHKVVSAYVQLVAATGFLGGYTTFSTMQWESVQLLRGGGTSQGLLYLLGTFALGVFVAAGGWVLGGWV